MAPSEELFAPPPAWSHPRIWAGLLVSPEADADLWAYRLRRESSTFVRIIRGKRCSTQKACIAEMAGVLQLPYCLESTWKSLHENLADGDWPAAKRGVLLFTAAQRLLQRDSAGFSQLLGILGEAATMNLTRRPPDTQFQIAFHCEPRYQGFMENRLEALNVPWGRIVL